MDLVYLDNNSTTAPAPEVVEAMLPYLTTFYGNPSSIHRFGQRSRQAIDEARGQVASLIGCGESELTFTGGGTEATNTAIRGMLAMRGPRKRVVISSVEHAATRELCNDLAAGGVEVVTIPVDTLGRLDLQRLSEGVDDQTALVSIMWANNETGVIFPVRQIADICRTQGVPFHCDATQAAGKIAVDVKEAGCDAITLAGHKFHGPKGVGALYVRRGLRVRPLLLGGPQENRRRGGTENVPGIVGMGKAAELAKAALPLTRVAELRDQLEREILARVAETRVNGDVQSRLPNTSNISFAPLAAEAILITLSEQNVCASAGAACSSGSLEDSHVLRAMGLPPAVSNSAIRFSLSRYTTHAQIARTLEILPMIVERLRRVMPS